MASIRIDIVGTANERSVHLELDESKEVSSYKVDASTGDVHVYYKRVVEADSESMDILEEAKQIEPAKKTLTGVVQPSVNVDLTAKTEAKLVDKKKPVTRSAVKDSDTTDTDDK